MAKSPEDKGSVAAPIAAAALPGAAAFLASRRVNETGMNQADRALAAKLRTGSLGRLVSQEDVWKGRFKKPLNTLFYGTPHVYPWDISTVGPKAEQHDVLYAPGETYSGKNFGKSQVVGAGPANRTARRMAENKSVEYGILNKYAPGSTGATTPVSSFLSGRPRSAADRLKALTAMQQQLSQRFRKGYVLKSTGGFNSAGTVITEKDNLANIFQKFTGMDRSKMKQLDALAVTAPNQWAKLVNRDPNLRKFMTIREMFKDPKSVLAQNKVNIQKLNPVERFLAPLFGHGASNTKEYRVHAIGNRVLPITQARYGPLEQAANTLGYRPQYMRDMESYVQDVLSKLPRNVTRNSSFGLDVARTPTGFKIIETNPSSYSGFLHKGKSHPATFINNQRLMSALRGQSTVPWAAAKGLGAVALGIGGYLTYRKVREMMNRRALKQSRQ